MAMERHRYVHLHRCSAVGLSEPEDEAYIEKVQGLLSAYPYYGVPPEPSQVTPGVYLGSTANAENIHLLKTIGITHILNCAGGLPIGLHRRRGRYPPETGILGYEELLIEEWEETDVRAWFEKAHNIIDYWRGKGGKVLIHCPAVSRSGAIALSYLIRTGIPLISATKNLKEKRRCLLNHHGFIRQLVVWARDRGMTDDDFNEMKAPTFGRALDRHRMKYAHCDLPLYL